jgi:putative membrane protein
MVPLVTEPDADRRWPRQVYGHGTEPDPRFSLANERTFLAWIRTTLALLAGAAAVHALDLDVKDAVARGIAVLLAASALVCAIHAWIGWSRAERALRESKSLPSNATGIAVVAVVAVASAVMIFVGAHG